MGGGGLLRIGLTHKDFRASLTIWVWVDFIVWRSEGASREGLKGKGTEKKGSQPAQGQRIYEGPGFVEK